MVSISVGVSSFPDDAVEAESLVLTDGTARDSGNGALDVRDGDILRVTELPQ